MQYSIKEVFSPKLLSTLRTYTRAQFAQDALAGIIVGIVAIVRPGGTLVIDGLLIFFLAAFFLVMGVVEIVMAFKTKAINKTWYLGLIVGILAVIVGIICFVYPSIAAITVGVLIGFFFIEIGISLISFATVSGDEA